MDLKDLNEGDYLLCVKNFTERKRPDFLKGKKYEVISIKLIGKYFTVTFRNENGIRHTLTTEYLKKYFGLTVIQP